MERERERVMENAPRKRSEGWSERNEGSSREKIMSCVDERERNEVC